MTNLTVKLTITTTTPVSVGAGGSSGTRADKSIVRNGWGRPIIPGSQVKGKVRHAAEALLRTFGQPVQAHFDDDDGESNLIRTLFGSPEVRSPLHFADLTGVVAIQETAEQARPDAIEARRLSTIRPSVALNRRRRVAEDERLFSQEIAVEGLRFTSERAITGQVEQLSHVALLWAALRLTTRWGGAKSRGLGWAQIDLAVQWDHEDWKDPELARALRELGKENS